MASNEKVNEKKEVKEERKFTKQNILQSNKYRNRRDFLNVVLNDNEEYPESYIKKIIKDKLGEVI